MILFLYNDLCTPFSLEMENNQAEGHTKIWNIHMYMFICLYNSTINRYQGFFINLVILWLLLFTHDN